MHAFLARHADTNQTMHLSEPRKIIAPVSGETLPIKSVPDPVFAEKLTGDGLAILAASDTVLAPCDGQITLFFETKHAFAITTADGIQVLVHVGLDTVILDGAGITALHKKGDIVTAGTPILRLDLPFLQAKKINLISPVLIVNTTDIQGLSPVGRQAVEAGRDTIIEYRLYRL